LLIAMCGLLGTAVAPLANASPLTLITNFNSIGSESLIFSDTKAVAVEFTMTGSFDLSTVTVQFLFPAGSASSDVTVGVFSDNSGDPGTLIDSTLTFDAGNTLVHGSDKSYLYDVPTSTTLPLDDGDNYWLVVENVSAGSSFHWLGSNSNLAYNAAPNVGSGANFVTTLASNAGETSWSTLDNPTGGKVANPYLQIAGTDAVPEPDTLALFAAGLAGLILMAAARRKNAARLRSQH
jgi:hypothetical protein